MSGTYASPLEIIKPHIDQAVALIGRQADEQAWPSILQPVWVEAVSELIRHALLQEGRADAAEIHSQRFRRLGYAQQLEIAARHGIAMDQFVRIVRTAQGYRRSSQRPPPRPSSTSSLRPRASGVEQIGFVIDPRLRKINPK